MCLQKGSGISLWFLRDSKVLVPDPIQVFINRNIYPECKEGFGVTEGNGGFETVRELENPRNNLQITGHGAAGIFNETETTSLSLP